MFKHLKTGIISETSQSSLLSASCSFLSAFFLFCDSSIWPTGGARAAYTNINKALNCWWLLWTFGIHSRVHGPWAAFENFPGGPTFFCWNFTEWMYWMTSKAELQLQPIARYFKGMNVHAKLYVHYMILTLWCWEYGIMPWSHVYGFNRLVSDYGSVQINTNTSRTFRKINLRHHRSCFKERSSSAGRWGCDSSCIWSNVNSNNGKSAEGQTELSPAEKFNISSGCQVGGVRGMSEVWMKRVQFVGFKVGEKGCRGRLRDEEAACALKQAEAKEWPGCDQRNQSFNDFDKFCGE